MPVRSSNSPVLTWPDRQEIERALHQWLHDHVVPQHNVLGVGYFGSYARNDWGVGSDLDLIILLDSSDQPFIQRAAMWDTLGLPVPTDVLVYTAEEWEALRRRKAQITQQEICWIYRNPS